MSIFLAIDENPTVPSLVVKSGRNKILHVVEVWMETNWLECGWKQMKMRINGMGNETGILTPF